MITMTPARDVKPGDIFSTDGYRVREIHIDADGNERPVHIVASLGGYDKAARFPADFPLPIWTPDEERA